MFNVLKMDLYRMAKSNATWIILLASMLMMFVSIFMTSQDIDYYNSNPIALENLQENGGEINWGIYIGSVNPKWCNGNEISLMDLVAVNIKSKLLLMFLVVFITYFVGSEGRNGFIKNIAGQVRNRSSLILGKFIAIGIFTIVMIVAAVFSTMLGSLIFLGYVNFVGIKQGLIFLVVQILLHIGYGMFILLLFNVTRSSIATMLSGILIAAGILQVVDAILFSIFKGLDSIEGFSVMKYLTSGNVGVLSINSSNAVYTQAGMIAVCAIVLMTVLSSIIIQRRDLQ
jgi:ABC-2 type transport system permease protein